MYRCFGDSLQAALLDRGSFQFDHKLLAHPGLTLESLAAVIPTLPKDRVMYSKGLLNTADDFETTFRRKSKDRTIEQTIETIRTTDSYIMVRGPECAPAFA